MVQPEMDAAADAAAQELEKLDPTTVRSVADWWKKHYLAAGHKRLGRKLVAKAGDQMAEELKELIKD